MLEALVGTLGGLVIEEAPSLEQVESGVIASCH